MIEARVSVTFVLVIAAALQPAGASTTGTLTVPYSFQGAPDGAYPAAPLVVGAGGVLYGVTSQGGSGNCSPYMGCGTVFSLTPPTAPGDSWTESVIYNFAGAPDGALPEGLTVASDGTLYGNTGAGGSGPCNNGLYNGCGTVFSLTPPASSGGLWTETVLYNFIGGTTDGMLPRATVAIGANNVLFGTTEYGGSGSCFIGLPGCGTVFSLSPPAGDPSTSWTESILHNFTDYPDGANPLAGVVIANGVLYGTTYKGGTAAEEGTVYSLAPPASGTAWTETVLTVFNGANGANPWSGVVIGGSSASGLVLYGTTYSGGLNGAGTVYSLTSPATAGGAWTGTVLDSFNGADGEFPIGGVVLAPGGALLGTTDEGGAGEGLGTLYALQPPVSPGGAWTETVLHTFQNGKAGYNPEASLVLGPGGMFYGTNPNGGVGGYGTVFAWKP